jgi:hypothetical protein
MKRRRVLQPPVTAADLNLKFSNGSWRGSLTIRNPEPFDVVLTRRYIDFVYDDVPHPQKDRPEQQQPDAFALGRRFLPAEGEQVNILLKAKLETKVDVTIRQKRLPPNHLTVRVTAVFDIPDHVSERFHVIPEVATLLKGIAQNGGVTNPACSWVPWQGNFSKCRRRERGFTETDLPVERRCGKWGNLP